MVRGPTIRSKPVIKQWNCVSASRIIALGVFMALEVSIEASTPMFTNISPTTVWTVSEDAPVNYVIGTTAGRDNDGDYPLVFSMANSGGGPFAIDATYGSLRVNAANTLNYRHTKSYAVTLRLTDSRHEFTEITIAVSVQGVNQPPILTTGDVDVTMREEEPPGISVPFQYHASDPNDGTILSYFLIGGDTSIFNIDRSSGDITLNTKVDVDPHARRVYRPTLRVSDGTLSATATLTLTVEDINDHAPVCHPLIMYKSVVEGSTGAMYPLSCSDDDSSLNGNNQLTYLIISGDNTKFSVSPAGVITLISAIDYETTTFMLLNVKVEDSASAGVTLATTATVIVSVVPLNDNEPVWSALMATDLAVSENVAVGTVIFTLTATDADVDVGGAVTYSITSVSDGSSPVYGVFYVDPKTGEVATLTKLDADRGVSQYIFEAKATDGGSGPHVITKTITLRLKDVNDNAPAFTGIPYPAVTIPEASAKSGSLVRTVSAIDLDLTASSLTYHVDAIIQGNTEVSSWRFNPAVAGQLEFATDLDLDTGVSAVSVLKLIVKDSGAPIQTGTATLTVSITPDNEFSPVIVSQPGSTVVSIAENRPIATQVAEVIATDGDAGSEGVLNYSITAGDPDKAFTIDSNGRITTRVVLDKETMTDLYQLAVKVLDSGLNPRSATTTVTVSVKDVNDHRPVCSFLFKTLILPETTQRYSAVTTIPCSDADPSDTLTFAIQPPYDTTFGFTTPVNEIKLLQDLDYDSPVQFYDFDVVVSDGVHFQTVKVSLNVGPVNEATPTFATNPSVSVNENVPLNPLLTYAALDADYSPHGIVSYAILSVTNGGTSLFSIDSTSGEIRLRSVLDYDSLPAADRTFQLVVVAVDGGGLQGTGTVTVKVNDLNDNSPVCLKSAVVVNMNEKQVGSAPYVVVSNLGCRDAESGTALTFSLSQEPGSHFSVKDNSVELNEDTLDFETATSHSLTIEVTDYGSPARTTIVTIYINVINMNEGGPFFPAFLPVFIDETIAIAQSVTDVIATDPDGPDPMFGDLVYSFVDGNRLNHFSLNAKTGRVITRKALDFETVPTYSLIVQAKERGGANAATATIDVNLNDINDEYPGCHEGFPSQTVPEDRPIGYVVIDLSCTDKDAGTVLTYTIVSGNNHIFNVVKNDAPVISLIVPFFAFLKSKMDGSQLKLKAQLDYEAYQSHDLAVAVSDSLASHAVIMTATIHVVSVNEGPPAFPTTPYLITVHEAQAVPHLVLSVLASDPDSVLDANGQVKYSFITNSAHFVIDQNNGQILLVRKLDRETEASHVLVVRAADASSFGTATVAVTVLDSNDNCPIFSSNTYSATVPDSAQPRTTILTVKATDLDDPGTYNYGTITYRLSGANIFAVGSATGAITNTVTLAASSYLLTVTAVDSGGLPGACTATALVTIIVTSVNRYDPVFTRTIQSVTISENQFAAGDIITAVTVTDADTGENGVFDMSLVSSHYKFSLTQNENIGYILLAQKLDFENGDTAFNLEITAVDHGAITRSSTGTVVIVVNDSNDNAPLCPRVINVDKLEGSTNITTLVCFDGDAGSILSFRIVSTVPGTISPVVSATSGTVSVATALDYEKSTSHVIIIKVQDNGTPIQSTSVTISLRVLDLNDNDPTLTGPFAFSISESETASVNVLYRAHASSNDGPTDVITYTLSDTTYFDISSTKGEITLATSAPDYETQGRLYMVDVCAVDTPNPSSRTSCHPILVTIENVNDNAPVFIPRSYSASIAESAGIGTALPLVTATDADSTPAFSTISYSLLSGAAGAWSINSSGSVTSQTPLDYETRRSYVLVVQASDGMHHGTAHYSIYVTPVNEFDPVFTSAAETVAVDENVALGTTLPISAYATDGDKGPDGALTYYIDAGPFIINPASGTVTVNNNLDRELITSYTLYVRAMDKGTPSRTGTLVLTININDVNDEAPECSSSLYTASVSESAAASTSIVTLVCHDGDDDPANINNALAYSIVSGDTKFFSVDTSGVVRSAVVFDREAISSFRVEVEVTDLSPTNKLTCAVSVTVTILDLNDNPPVFTSLPNRLLREDTALGTTVGTVSALDADEGINSHLQFQISSGNQAATFFVDQTSGHIILQGILDYETGPHIYNLEITVNDKGSPAHSSVGTVTFNVTDVNDSPPVCATLFYTATIPENSVNSLVTTVTCTDIDSVGSLAYSITAGNTNGDFTIDSDTGTIRTSPNAAVSYESTRSYTLQVSASDGIHAATTIVRVSVTDVNEFSPRFSPTGLHSVRVSEDVTVGHVVIAVSATDDDPTDTVKIYSIIVGNGGGKFIMDSLSGVVRVQDLLDYEVTQSYRLTLQVEDAGGLTDAVLLDVTVVNVDDNSPACTEESVAVNVIEGLALGTIYTPTCSDADMTYSDLEYTIVTGNHSSIDISFTTGELFLVGAMDYEDNAFHYLTIQVSDKATPVQKTVSINVNISITPVNEYNPVFIPSFIYGPFFVSENSTTDTPIARMIATDLDKGLKHGIVRYYIVAGDPQQQFGIDRATGLLVVVRALDREARDNYSLTVRALDDKPGSPSQRTADATCLVTITDVNDHPPTFSPELYMVSVLESAPYGPAVVLQTLTVLDDDIGVNGVPTITIASGNTEEKFSVVGDSLILSGQLDYETTRHYDLVLQVADGGNPSLKSSGRVIVNVQPFNERAPLMTTPAITKTIAEDTPVGTLVFQANATDSDSGTDGEIVYSIVSGAVGNVFVLNPLTGQLYVGSQLDYDASPTTYSIIIKATDGSGLSDALTSTVSLSLVLQDVNDHVPQFTVTMFTFSVNENVAMGTPVGTVVATDADSGLNGAVRYTSIGGNGYDYFNIDSITGLVTVAADIDYEQFQIVYLSVQAQDGGAPSHTSTGLVKIQINNMNDNDPIVAPQDIAVLVSEGTPVGSTVFIYTASDKDTVISAYQLATSSSFFQVDASTGAVLTNALLDRETSESHFLHILVMDQATSEDFTVRTFTATLTMVVEDINDNDPVITGTYTPSIPEDSSISSLVCSITASDLDLNQNAQLTFSIIAGNVGLAFKMDSTGNVLVAAPLDRESIASYKLTILVSDKGTPSRANQIDITIFIEDINDNSPAFEQPFPTFSVSENSNIGTTVGTLAATDPDYGVNGSLIYSIDASELDHAMPFIINGATGTITVAYSGIDRETLASYVVRIKVTDSGSPFSRSAITSVTIYVEDLNDNPPLFDRATYNASIEENSPVAVSVLKVHASDADLGSNAVIFYSIDTTMMDGLAASMFFEVDVDTGIISPKVNIDYEKEKTFHFIVRATDGGHTALTAASVVKISIIDVNDNRPIFNPVFYNAETAYSGHCGNEITTVTATDADYGGNGIISYSLETAAYNYLFSINSSSGQLSLRSVAAAYAMYSLDVQASDAGNPILTAVTAARVRVDSFVPNNHVVTFRLKITRSNFVAKQEVFIANLQTVIRNVYHTALVRLFCIEEYDGEVEMSLTLGRRLLAESPVDVHLYVVEDDSSNSVSNMDSQKAYLKQDQFLSIVSRNPNGAPGSNVQGAAWDYFKIKEVREYHEKAEDWLEMPHGIAITVLVCLLGLLLLVLTAVLIVRYCCGRSGLRRPPMKKPHHVVSAIAPVSEVGVKEPTHNRSWDADENYATDGMGQPYRNAFPPMLITDPLSPRLSTNKSATLNNINTLAYQQIPSPAITTASQDSGLDVNCRHFDGELYDQATGKLYEYKGKTNQRRWM